MAQPAVSISLHQIPEWVLSAKMKFLWAMLIWLVMGAIITTGIVLATIGKPWLLIVGLLGFIVAVGKIGCATH